MSGNNNENLPKTEIGNFKSPEELAVALEGKNKNLAEKIRRISQESIANNSKDLRKKLQDELSAEEQKQIRETLPGDIGVAQTFTKGMSQDEQIANAGKVALAGAIGKDKAEMIEKGEGIWNKISTGFDKIGDIFDQKGIMAGLGALFIMLKGFFSGDFSQLDEILNPKQEDEKNGSEKLGTTDVKYQYSSSALSYIFGGKHKSTLNKMFSIDKFQNMKYTEAKEIYKKYTDKSNKDGIEKEIGIEGVKSGDVFHSLGVLVNEKEKSSSIIQDYYKKKGEDIGNKSIKDIITGLYSNIKMFKNMENITTPDQIFDAGKQFALKIDELPNGQREIKGEIAENLNDLGINKNIILFIHSRGKNGYEDIIELEKNLDGIQSELTIQDKKELKEKFIPFAKNIENTLGKNFGHNYGEKIIQCFNSNHLKPIEILELYAITGGNHDYNKMSDMEKTYIYTKLISLIDDRDKELAGGYGTYIMKEGETPLPAGVLSIFSYLGEKLVDGGKNIGLTLWGAAQESPAVAGMMALTLYFGPWFSSKESAHEKMSRIFKRK